MKLVSIKMSVGAMAVAVIFSAYGVLFAQMGPRPNAAVYVLGNPPNRAILQAAFSNALVNSGRYNVIAVDAIEAAIKEHKRQMNESVRTSDIVEVGNDAGAAFILAVRRIDAGSGAFNLHISMVSMKDKVTAMSNILAEPVSDRDNIVDVINTQVAVLLKMRPPTPKGGADMKNVKVYRTVTIGDLAWTAENLNHKIGNSWCYADKDSNCIKYGRLYDWQTAETACPTGWRLPTRADWDNLVNSVGGEKRGGKAIKSSADWNGEDNYGYGALPAGQRHPSGTFNSIGDIGSWWTSTENDNGSAYIRYINSSDNGIYESNAKKGAGYSVRCVPE